ncbi:MAG TPA: acetylglutamate kinase [Puia sp.]|jgi:acetylglutamate kinase|nr:acetylglutamate kinase [Puia sp.]
MKDNLHYSDNLNPPSGDRGNNMYYGASNLIFERAKELRNTMTAAEQILWNHLHINEWKLKFRRQHPIANYIVDFYCHEKKLVIELDGGIHEVEDVKKWDEYREQHLKELGLTVIRFKNEEIFKEKKQVIEKIYKIIREPNPPLGDRGNLFVIKIGGNIIDDEKKLSSFLTEFARIFSNTDEFSNHPFRGRGLLVHGGGKLATKLADELGIQQKLIDGRRITDAETLKIVTMVYAGFINKNMVAQLQSKNCNAIGLCGADANIIQAHKRPPLGDVGIDYGFVGDIDNVNGEQLMQLINSGLTPIIAPITSDTQGQLLNTNADTIAQEIAKAMSSYYNVQLIYSFEKSGVLLDVTDENSVIKKLTPEYYQELKTEEKIFAGMIPKIDNAFAALNSGVKKVIIGNAEKLNDLINNSAGTTITNE